MLDSFNTFMAGSATVSLSGNVFSILPTGPGFINDCTRALNGDSTAIASWHSLVNAVREQSNAVSLTLPGYGIVILNPVNTDLVLLQVKDGLVYYDFTK